MFQFIKDQIQSASQIVQSSGILSSQRTEPQQIVENEIQEEDLEIKPPQFLTPLYTKYLRQKILSLFEQFEGRKILVIDKFISECLSLIFDSLRVLRDIGIEERYYLDSDELNCEENQVIFFVQPKREYMKRIVRIISYLIIFCPRSTIICKEYLEKEGVAAQVQIKNCNFDLIPLDQDLLSLEYNDCLNQLWIQKDQTVLNLIAESIQRMQVIFGKFKNIYCKGDQAKELYNILQSRMENMSFDDDDGFANSKLDSLIVFDRSIDYVSPFATPFTYQAIVDEFFEINQNCIIIDPKIVTKGGLQRDKIKVMKLIKTFDPIFHSIKNYNIKKVIKYLEVRRQENASIIKEKDKRQLDSDYLDKVAQIQREHNHILDHYVVSGHIHDQIESIEFILSLQQEANTVCQLKNEKTLEHIENLVSVGAPYEKVLRLLILNSQINNGIRTKFYEYIKREMIQTYGVKMLFTFTNLERLGILKKNNTNELSIWDKIKKPLRLINEEVDQDNPNDFSYVYLAYAPISVRLVQEIVKYGSWKNQLQSLREIQGETIMQQNLNKQQNDPQQQNGCIVVYFIGGICYGEIAALRWLAQKSKREIIICTTHVTNGSKTIKQLSQFEVKELQLE